MARWSSMARWMPMPRSIRPGCPARGMWAAAAPITEPIGTDGVELTTKTYVVASKAAPETKNRPP